MTGFDHKISVHWLWRSANPSLVRAVSTPVHLSVASASIALSMVRVYGRRVSEVCMTHIFGHTDVPPCWGVHKCWSRHILC